MISEIVTQKIAEFTKSGDKVSLSVWRSVKDEFTKYKVAKAGNVLTEGVELQLIQKMVAQRKDSYEQFKAGGRLDLAEAEEKEAQILSQMLPKEPTEEDIRLAVEEAVNALKTANGAISMKDMKSVQASVRSKYPTANGGMIATIFRNFV